MNRTRSLAMALAVLLCTLVMAGPGAAQSKPEGEMRLALYVTVAPAWLDPGEVVGVLTPFWVLYALHDALVKPMPGNHQAPSLAESWTMSPDQKSYEFKLRKGVKFHNGDPFTAEDVKFSFQRAKAKLLHEKVKEVVVVDPHRVRFVLHEPWPDFMTFYGTFVSGAAWIMPKKYFEKVGVDAFKKQPIGLGPYKFVSRKPGIELVMEANEGYWRKVPSVKRLVFKSVPEATTRMAMLKRGEVDLAYLIDTPMAARREEGPQPQAGLLRRHRHLLSRLPRHVGSEIAVGGPARAQGGQPRDRPEGDQRGRDGRRVSADRQHRAQGLRVRAADRALSVRSREGQEAVGRGRLSERVRCGRSLPVAALLLGGRGGRDLTRRRGHQDQAAHDGARGLLRRPLHEEAEGDLHVRQCRLRQRLHPHGGDRAERRGYAYGGWPDVDELYKQQAREADTKKREVMLHQIQQILHERVRFAPIFDYFWPSGVGPRVEDPALMMINPYPWSAPYEEVKLKKK